MRISIFAADDPENSLQLMKVEPHADQETLLHAIDTRLGFRPSALFVGDARITCADDLEEGDKLRCQRELAGARTAAASATPASAPEATSSQKRPREDGDGVVTSLHVTVRLNRDAGDIDEVQFRIKPTTKLAKVVHSYHEKKGAPIGTYRITFDGERVNPDNEKTAEQWGIEDGDSLDAFLQQEGGDMRSNLLRPTPIR